MRDALERNVGSSTTPRHSSGQLRFLCLAAALSAVALASASVVNAQVSEAVVHSFGSPATDGNLPFSGVIQASDGLFYGTTFLGGANGRGTIYRTTADGVGYTVLHDFAPGASDGANPRYGNLIQGIDGFLYGTTAGGGAGGEGTIFQMALDGTGFTILHSFTAGVTDGAQPYGGVIQGIDDALYGTTLNGGSANTGVVFRMNIDSLTFSILHSFAGGDTDGRNPYNGVIQAADGTLWGTTDGGGILNDGTIYRLSTDGTGFSVVHSFGSSPTDGRRIFGRLLQAIDGTIYGTTYFGGTSNSGTIYAISSDGTIFTIVHNFTNTIDDGANPWAGLTQAPDGTLYGTSQNGGGSGLGTVFQMAPDGTGFSVLYSFLGGATDGWTPAAAVFRAIDGSLYGTTTGGGAANGGVVFQLTFPPVP